ncbi:MAG: homoserine dehydrogenase, partial [Candidatus Altiarchaeota archaeon]|nr:homoserine dehydrogenase [Candidatus Altiarchaeota archaeon]
MAVCEAKGSAVDERGIDLAKLLESPNWSSRKTIDVIRSVPADIVVEVTPGSIRDGEPGLSHIKAALESGKNVVTSNKAPLVVAFSELSELAKKRGVKLKFEATVGGAIPLINLYENDLAPNSIESILGVLNGTTNYILTKMSQEGVDY